MKKRKNKDGVTDVARMKLLRSVVELIHCFENSEFLIEQTAYMKAVDLLSDAENDLKVAKALDRAVLILPQTPEFLEQLSKSAAKAKEILRNGAKQYPLKLVPRKKGKSGDATL